MKSFGLFLAALCLFSRGTAYSKCVLGDCSNGYGVYSSEGYTYTGEFKNGMLYGHGTMVFPDGRTLSGISALLI